MRKILKYCCIVLFLTLPSCSLLDKDSGAMKFEIDEWRGKDITDFEFKYGSKGQRFGSGLSVYKYTINEKNYYVSVYSNGIICNIMEREENGEEKTVPID